MHQPTLPRPLWARIDADGLPLHIINTHFDVEKIDVPRNHLTRVASDHLPLIADLAWSKRDQALLAVDGALR